MPHHFPAGKHVEEYGRDMVRTMCLQLDLPSISYQARLVRTLTIRIPENSTLEVTSFKNFPWGNTELVDIFPSLPASRSQQSLQYPIVELTTSYTCHTVNFPLLDASEQSSTIDLDPATV